MNYRIIFRIARIHALSFLRRSQASQQNIEALVRRPIAILLFDVSGFILSAFLGYILNLLGIKELSAIIDEALIFAPSVLIVMPIIYGVLFEFSQSSTFSTEAINWMPITAQEYVLGSALSTIFILSPIISLVLGFTCGLVVIGRGLYLLWVSIFLLGVLALSGGAFVVEIIRAVINRVSSAFYSRGGRSTIYVRFVLSVIVFLAVMLLLNFNFLLFLLETYAVEISAAWYVPLIWPSLAIMALIEKNMLMSVAYGISFGGFCVLIYVGSVKLRQKYWIPQPVSIKVSSALYRPKKGLLEQIGYSQIEAALIRKDLRSIIRRKEMIRIVVAPLFSTVIIIVTMLMTPEMENPSNGLFNLFFSMGPILFGWLLGITSFGQEGDSISVIYSLPITEKELVKAKVSSSFFLALIALTATLCFVYIVLPTSPEFILLFTFLSLLLTIEAAIIGVAAGAKYPNFSTTPRSRFITVTGSFIGIVWLGIGMLAIAWPFLIFYAIDSDFMTYIVALGGLMLNGFFVCFFSNKIALKSTYTLLERKQIS